MPCDRAEVWRPIPGYEGRYEASDWGRVRSLRNRGYNYDKLREIPLLMRSAKARGYLRMSFGEKDVWVHRVVLEAFTGPAPHGMQVNHKNGDKTDNRPQNLEWASGFENQRHAHRTGLFRPRPDLCPRGHRYDATGGFIRRGIHYQWRRCRICANLSKKKRRAAKRCSQETAS